MECPLLAWAALEIGREAEVVGVLDGEPFKYPWLGAAVAVASRDFNRAADIFGGSSFKAIEAFFRLQSATEPDVRAALEFYRGVGATRYLREAEALPAVSA